MKGNVLIFGCGQVGAFASAALERAGYSPIVADKAPAGGYFARYGASSTDEILPIDAADPGAVTAAVRAHGTKTAILTFGMTGKAFESQAGKAQEDSIYAAVRCARAAIAAGVCRLIYVSSFAVYGRQETGRLCESDTLAPDTNYGRGKLKAEQALIETARGAAELLILRPCGVYGPIRFNGGSHSARLVDSLLFAASKDKQITVEWSPVDVDEYIYIKDLAEAIGLAVSHPPGFEVGIYNVGSGTKIGATDLRRAVQNLFPRAKIELREIKPQQPRQMPLLDSSKISEVLGFRPRFDLESGVRDQALISGLIQ